MVRPRLITDDQVHRVIILYADDVAIKEIMRQTNIKSEQTVYRILDANGISRRPKKRCSIKRTISFEDDVEMDILEHSDNVSAFICECIRKARLYDAIVK